MDDANELRALATQIADFVESWNGTTRDGDTLLIANGIRDRFVLIASREAAVKPLGDDAGLVADLRDWPTSKSPLTVHGERLKAADRLETLTRELDKAREALEPFASESARWSHHEGSDRYSFAGTGLSRGDIRRAAELCAALSATTDLGRDTENAG